MSRKICVYCNKRKNSGSFPKHKHYKDNLDNRCKKCIKRHTKLRYKLRKKSPVKSDDCDCCHKIVKKLCLDHDHDDNSFRGWLCDKCNTGIGKLGDNLQGIINALKYLTSRTQINDPKMLDCFIKQITEALNDLLAKKLENTHLTNR